VGEHLLNTREDLSLIPSNAKINNQIKRTQADAHWTSSFQNSEQNKPLFFTSYQPVCPVTATGNRTAGRWDEVMGEALSTVPDQSPVNFSSSSAGFWQALQQQL
jgi:hypothetical protein